MTAPLLSTRDALAKALTRPVNVALEDYKMGRLSNDGIVRSLADALFASGAVVDAATLADDAALVEAVAADQKEAADSWGDPLPGAELSMRARTALRALAKALTERGA